MLCCLRVKLTQVLGLVKIYKGLEKGVIKLIEQAPECINSEKKIKEKFIVAILIAGIIIGLFWIAINYYEGKVYPYKIDGDCIYNEIRSNVDSIITESRYIVITGWAFYPEKQWRTLEERIILVDKETGEGVSIPTEVCERSDVQELYGNEKNNYTLSGFYARVNTNKILFNNNYDVYVSIILDGHEFVKKIDENIVEESSNER